MTMSRPFLYVGYCDADDCRESMPELIARFDAKPTPAEWARRELRAAGWFTVSRGNHMGWRIFCPDHGDAARAFQASVGG